MARLHTNGAELQSAVSNVEVTTVTGTGVSISTSVKRSGLAAWRMNAVAAAAHIEYQYASSGPLQNFYYRFYLRIASAPSGTTDLMIGRTTVGATTNPVRVRLLNDRTLEFLSGNTSYGFTSALNLDQWYRIEVGATGDGTGVITGSELRIDGVSVLTGTPPSPTMPQFMRVGILNNVTAEIYIDDIAINNNVGSDQNSWPGEGSIVHVYPNAAGDNSQWQDSASATQGTSLYTNVDEVTPDDSTTYNKRTTNTPTTLPIDDFEVDSSSTAGIGSNDTIKLVQVGFRGGAISTTSGTQRQLDLRLKSASGGTVTTVTGIPIHVNGFTTNHVATPKNYQLTSYTDPTTGVVWTPTGTNSIDNMQIGYRATVSSATEIRVSTLWAAIEYVPAVVTPSDTAASKFFF